jgi:hypothetical protein
MGVRSYIRSRWSDTSTPNFVKGDYVVATKYADGDPGDHFCVGFYDSFYDHYGKARHVVVDSEGKPFRANGFRKARKVSSRRGTWMVRHLAHIESMKDRYSVWHWWRAPWAELDAVDAGETP